jgi:hypothetical protein
VTRSEVPLPQYLKTTQYTAVQHTLQHFPFIPHLTTYRHLLHLPSPDTHLYLFLQ